MPTTMPYGETVEVLMEVGFLVNYFTLDDATLGQLDTGGYLDGTLVGDDVSPYLQEMTIVRGRTDQQSQMQTGTASFSLINNDRRFDPINQSSPYWDSAAGRTGVQPRRKVTVKLNGVSVFVGKITDIDVEYDQQRSFVTIDASDDFVLLANTNIESDFYPSVELSSVRLSTILDLPEVDYPATRSISTGTATLGAYQITSGTNVLTYIQKINEAEGGYVFIDGGGDLNFIERKDAIFGNSAVAFADDGTGIPYAKLGVSYGQEFLYNKVIIKNSGGVEQIADDVASQAEYGVSTLSKSDMLLSTDAQALVFANYLLDKYKEPVFRLDSLGIVMNDLSSGQKTSVLGLELSDALSIKKTYSSGTPATVTSGFGVQRITHKLTSISHSVLFGLEVRDIVYELILDNATYGVLDSTNALA